MQNYKILLPGLAFIRFEPAYLTTASFTHCRFTEMSRKVDWI